jgi:hypothetical protein
MQHPRTPTVYTQRVQLFSREHGIKFTICSRITVSSQLNECIFGFITVSPSLPLYVLTIDRCITLSYTPTLQTTRPIPSLKPAKQQIGSNAVRRATEIHAVGTLFHIPLFFLGPPFDARSCEPDVKVWLVPSVESGSAGKSETRQPSSDDGESRCLRGWGIA